MLIERVCADHGDAEWNSTATETAPLMLEVVAQVSVSTPCLISSTPLKPPRAPYKSIAETRVQRSTGLNFSTTYPVSILSVPIQTVR
jgi:hypothetical protein